MRLLIVEDNARLSALMAKLLSEQVYAVDSAASVDEALAALDAATFDLVVLDLALPDGEGAEVLKAIRHRGHGTAVLVVTARGGVGQRVQMLDQGADDYLVKPFSFDELLARVRALLRRPRQVADPGLAAGNVRLDTAAMILSVAGAPVEAPRRELGVLAALMRSQGRLLPRQKLADAVYSFDNEVTPNAIEAAVSRLRRRMEAHGASVTITAMRGLGYILAPARDHADTA